MRTRQIYWKVQTEREIHTGQAIQQCLLESHNTTGVSAEEMRPRETALTPFIYAQLTGTACRPYARDTLDQKLARDLETCLRFNDAALDTMASDGRFRTVVIAFAGGGSTDMATRIYVSVMTASHI